MKPELLSPAGSYDAAVAAFQYGADAVYLGLSAFSARAEAHNLSFDELMLLRAYADTFVPTKKIYIALNTLLHDSELPEFFRILSLLTDLRPDGVIVQDLGATRMIRKNFPELELHASTQMAAHNIDSIMALHDLGFKRVVLARELSLTEIEAIVANCPLEIEIFVHGALCYSYSGLCLFSAQTQGRSGNRGCCAYCCRHPFQMDKGKTGHPFSMKDLALLPILDQVTATGAHSLKIEGRMKNALYVACVTSVYRQKLDGGLTTQAELNTAIEEIQTIFSRPWSTLYTETKQPKGVELIDPDTVGHRGAPIGRVIAVNRDKNNGQWLRLITSRPLLKFDGIQIDIDNQPRPFGFSIRAMRCHGDKRETVQVPALSDVEIMITEKPVPRIDVGALVYCASSQEIQQKYRFQLPRAAALNPGIPVDFNVRVEPESITVEAISPVTGDTAAINIKHALQPAKNSSMTKDAVQKACSKLGNTNWRLNSAHLFDNHSLFIPPTLLNQARREVASQLDAQRAQRLTEKLNTYLKTLESSVSETTFTRSSTGAMPEFTLKIHINAHQLPDAGAVAGCNKVVVEIDDSDSQIILQRVGAIEQSLPAITQTIPALPLIMRSDQRTQLMRNIRVLAEQGYTRWETPSLAGLQLLIECGVKAVSADWTLYVCNQEAALQLRELGFVSYVTSPELSLDTIPRESAQWCEAELLTFQHTPLYISATPPCVSDIADKSERVLKNEHGLELKIHQKGREWITTSTTPLDRSGVIEAAMRRNIHRFRVDYSWSKL